MRHVALTLRLVALFCLSALAAPSVRAQVLQPFFATDSVTYTITDRNTIENGFRWGDHVFASGFFHASTTYPPSNRTGIWELDIRTGEPITTPSFYRVIGPDSAGVTASVGLPDDGLIAYRRNGLVRLTANGDIADRWDLPVNFGVQGLQLYGDTLFLYGGFTRLGGLERRGVAAVRMSTREVLPFAPLLYDNFRGRAVITQLQATGERVFVSGANLRAVGDILRDGVAGLRRSDGTLLTWKPQDEVTVSVLNRLGLVACLKTSTSTCYRYSYTTGGRGALIPNGDKVVRPFGDGWLREVYVQGILEYRTLLSIHRSDGLATKVYEGYSAFLTSNKIYSNAPAGYGVLDHYKPYCGSGCDRSKLFIVSEEQPDTTASQLVAYMGGHPEVLSVLGHQMYASTRPEYVVPTTVRYGPSLLAVEAGSGRPVQQHPLRACGQVRSVAPAGNQMVYFGGEFNLSRDGESCVGTRYRLVRLDARTGVRDATFAPQVFDPASRATTEIKRLRAVPHGVLVATQGHQYQPDVLRAKPGALALYSHEGQLLDPMFQVFSGSSWVTVERMETVGDSLVVIAGSFDGRFDEAGGEMRNNFAVLRLSDGTVTPAVGPTGRVEYTGLVIRGFDAYVSVTLIGATGLSYEWWRIPVSGGTPTQLCPSLSTSPLVGRIGDMFLAGGTGLRAVDMQTCTATRFTYPDGHPLGLPVSSVLVDGRIIWGFGDRIYKFSHPYPVSAEEEETLVAADHLRVWPNPARDAVTVEAPGDATQPRRVAVVDVLGRVVWSGALEAGERNATIDVSAWPAGWYGVTLTTDRGDVMGRTSLVRMR